MPTSSAKRVSLSDRVDFYLFSGDEATRPKNPRVEYAASGRGACVDCKKTISEGELRIKYKSSYHHPQCLANKHVYRKTAEE